jgi:hypothetical protein
LRYAGHDQQRYKAEELFEAGAILLGRVTYEIFAAFSAARPGTSPSSTWSTCAGSAP